MPSAFSWLMLVPSSLRLPAPVNQGVRQQGDNVSAETVIERLRQLGAGSNSICVTCRKNNSDLSNALGPWVDGHFPVTANKAVFVGKIARGDGLGQLVSNRLEDVSAFGTEFIRSSSWPYWSYTREIITRVFGSLDEGLKYCGFTNLIKCNNSSTPDTSTETQRHYCIDENRFIAHELNVMQPKAVIFYVGTEYDEYLQQLFPESATGYEDEINTRVTIGAKRMPWWSRRFFDSDGATVARYLRIGHPERMKKEPYISEVAKWIVDTFQRS